MGGQTYLFIFQYSMADILDIVQASEAEINTALLKMQALIIDGRFNTLHAEFFFYMFLLSADLYEKKLFQKILSGI